MANKKENSENLVKRMFLSISMMSFFIAAGVENANAMKSIFDDVGDDDHDNIQQSAGPVSAPMTTLATKQDNSGYRLAVPDSPSLPLNAGVEGGSLILQGLTKDTGAQSGEIILNFLKGKKEDILLSNLSSDAINDIFPTKKARKLYKKLQQELDKVYVKRSKSDVHSSSDLSSSSSSSESSNAISTDEAESLCSSIVNSVRVIQADLFEECSLILEKISSICNYSYTNECAKRLLLKDVVNALSNKDVDIQCSLTFLYKVLIAASSDYVTADDGIYNAILFVLNSHKDEIDAASLLSKTIDIKSTEFFSLVGKLVFEIQFYNKNLRDMEILFSVAELLKLHSPDYYNKEVKTFLSALMD